MIVSDDITKQLPLISGDITDISAECFYVMQYIYRYNLEKMGKEVATGILANMLVECINTTNSRYEAEKAMELANVPLEEKLEYTE